MRGKCTTRAYEYSTRTESCKYQYGTVPNLLERRKRIIDKMDFDRIFYIDIPLFRAYSTGIVSTNLYLIRSALLGLPIEIFRFRSPILLQKGGGGGEHSILGINFIIRC